MAPRHLARQRPLTSPPPSALLESNNSTSRPYLDGHIYKGTCISVSPLAVVGRNGTQKGSIVLRVPDGNYEQYLPIDFFGKFAECVERAEVGGVYEVRALLKGREWTSPQGVIKYFLSLTGVSLKAVDGSEPEPATEGEQSIPEMADEAAMREDDGLPF